MGKRSIRQRAATGNLVALATGGAEELVDKINACPHCGNRVLDNLVWRLSDRGPGDRVYCAVCRRVYVPPMDTVEAEADATRVAVA